MNLTISLLNSLTQQAKSSPRLRASYDLRNSASDNSQRLLNALEPGTVVPIHRHPATSETLVVLRGKLKETFFNDRGEITGAFVCEAGSEIFGCNIPAGQWHTVESLESGTVIFEAKDGKYEPTKDEDILQKPTICQNL